MVDYWLVQAKLKVMQDDIPVKELDNDFFRCIKANKC